MTNTSKTIIFFGTDDFSAASLKALLAAGFKITAVVTKPDSAKGRSRSLQPSITKVIAQQHNIAVWQPATVSALTANLTNLTASTGVPPLGVLVSYGKIIPAAIIDLFSPSIVNVHPSLLPLYRGPSPIETAVLNGDTKTGVSIMQLSAAMDAGPVYKQIAVPLTGRETGPQLRQQLAELGAQQLVASLADIINGELRPTPQNDAAASYCRLFTKDDAWLDLTQLTAAQVDRHVRAYLGYPKSKLTIAGQSIIITQAHASADNNEPLALKCADGNYLVIDELVSPSGKTMTAGAFANGYLKS